jgi:uncharacterized alkaline shock family protein YloU
MKDSDEIVIGELKIAESVVVRMVRDSAGAVEGVSQIKETKVRPEDNALAIDLALSVGYKTVYPDVAEAVQAAVAHTISDTTGMAVSEVNVSIERLDFSKE